MRIASLRAEHNAYLAVMQVAYPLAMVGESPRRARRRQKLEELLIEVGGPAKAAVETGTPKSHFSAMINGRRGIGDALAAKLEDTFGKPRGWFDQEDQAVALSPDVADLAMKIEAIKDADKRAEILSLCHLYVRHILGVDDDQSEAKASPQIEGETAVRTVRGA
jgi:hypothetical protein